MPESNPDTLRVAIVGSGPSGFYAAGALLEAGIPVKVDLFDRLPAPFGLVRYGVAPDHPKIKTVTRIFERIAGSHVFSYFGNVTVGKDVGVRELKDFYDAIIFATGTEKEKTLGIPGEDLPGSYSAAEFVAWYNGHPHHVHRSFDLDQEVAVIVGQGNVALDCARLLCKTVEELKHTDIAAHALETFARSRIREVHLIGRRGPLQAAFTPAEIRAFGDLEACVPVVSSRDLELDEASREELEDPANARARKNWEILREFAARPVPERGRRFIIHFYERPVALEGGDRVRRLRLEKTRLVGPAGRQKAEGTGVFVTMPCGIFFRSVGYRGVPIEGVPYDEERGIFPNRAGRIVDERGRPVPGLYCTGWIKRGPSGVIGANKVDSQETVEALLADRKRLPRAPRRRSRELLKHLIQVHDTDAVSFEDWKKIDRVEVERGRPRGKPREKFVFIEDMLAVLE